jgi:hypothetical protein
MEATIHQHVTLQVSGRLILAAIELWSKGVILTSSRREHQRKAEQGIEALTKQLVTDWNLDNK